MCLQFWKVKQVQGKGIHCWNWENFYHSKITVLQSIKYTCSFKNVNANIPKIWGFSREKLKISKEAQDFHVYRVHFCYLSLNFLVNVIFMIHDKIFSWFLDQFYKRQIALCITDHFRSLLKIKIHIFGKTCLYFSTFQKHFWLPHLYWNIWERFCVFLKEMQ